MSDILQKLRLGCCSYHPPIGLSLVAAMHGPVGGVEGSFSTEPVRQPSFRGES